MKFIIELLTHFKNFLSYNVPLGVHIFMSLLFLTGYMKLQSNRRKDYEISLNSSKDLINQLNETLSQREKVIRELEGELHALMMGKGGK